MHRYFSLGWGRVQSTLWHFVRLQSQFNNYLEVEVLPVYRPSEEEKQSPRLYADNVRRLMAERLGVPLSPQGLPQWLVRTWTSELGSHGHIIPHGRPIVKG
jgi:hypothetical protein